MPISSQGRKLYLYILSLTTFTNKMLGGFERRRVNKRLIPLCYNILYHFEE